MERTIVLKVQRLILKLFLRFTTLTSWVFFFERAK